VTIPLVGVLVLFILISMRTILLAAAIATIDYVIGLIRSMPFWSVLVVVLLFLIWRSVEKLGRRLAGAAGEHDET
jgi:hypothetical protein